MRRTIVLAGVLFGGCCFGPEAAPQPVQTAPVAPVVAAPAQAAPEQAAPVVAAPVQPAVAEPVTPRVREEGFDLRAVIGDPGEVFVLLRGRPAEPSAEPIDPDAFLLVRPAGPVLGDPVRVVRDDGVCDGTLGARVHLTASNVDVESDHASMGAARLVGCSEPGIFAIVHPTPSAPWPAIVDEDEPDAASAIAAARVAAIALARGSSAESFDARAYRLGADVYAMAWGPRCDEEEMGCIAAGTAVVVQPQGQAARTLIVRPVHFVWDEPTDAGFSPCGITDVDGDGQIELCESMFAEQGSLTRLIRPGERQAGDVVWRLSYLPEEGLPSIVGPAPPPI